MPVVIVRADWGALLMNVPSIVVIIGVSASSVIGYD